MASLLMKMQLVSGDQSLLQQQNLHFLDLLKLRFLSSIYIMRFRRWPITNYECTLMWNTKEQTTGLAPWLQRPPNGLLLIKTML